VIDALGSNALLGPSSIWLIELELLNAARVAKMLAKRLNAVSPQKTIKGASGESNLDSNLVKRASGGCEAK
jgi:hypothetical protein